MQRLKIFKITFLFGLFIILACSATNVNAYASIQPVQTYPLPNAKPKIESQKEIYHETINKKQAAAAVLGLYFGVNTATGPAKM
jgi:hypothetical protein